VHPPPLNSHSQLLAAVRIPRVQMRADRCPQVTVLAISGDVDAGNGERIQDVVARCALGGDALILNLSGVEFFGARGISVLIAIRDIRQSAATPWALIPSRVVSRVLQLTAYGTELPSAGSVRDAVRLLTDVSGGPR
jgi:anti-anti-sigma factor